QPDQRQRLRVLDRGQQGGRGLGLRLLQDGIGFLDLVPDHEVVGLVDEARDFVQAMAAELLAGLADQEPAVVRRKPERALQRLVVVDAPGVVLLDEPEPQAVDVVLRAQDGRRFGFAPRLDELEGQAVHRLPPVVGILLLLAPVAHGGVDVRLERGLVAAHADGVDAAPELDLREHAARVEAAGERGVVAFLRRGRQRGEEPLDARGVDRRIDLCLGSVLVLLHRRREPRLPGAPDRVNDHGGDHEEEEDRQPAPQRRDFRRDDLLARDGHGGAAFAADRGLSRGVVREQPGAPAAAHDLDGHGHDGSKQDGRREEFQTPAYAFGVRALATTAASSKATPTRASPGPQYTAGEIPPWRALLVQTSAPPRKRTMPPTSSSAPAPASGFQLMAGTLPNPAGKSTSRVGSVDVPGAADADVAAAVAVHVAGLDDGDRAVPVRMLLDDAAARGEHQQDQGDQVLHKDLPWFRALIYDILNEWARRT